MLIFGLAGCIVPFVLNIAGGVLGRAAAARLLSLPVRMFAADLLDGYRAASAWRRALWHAGGPLGAYFACFLLSLAVTLAEGTEVPTRAIAPLDGSVAMAAGIREGDVVTEVDGKAVGSWEELRVAVRGIGDRTAPLVLVRGDRDLTLSIRPIGGLIGVRPVTLHRPRALRSAARTAVSAPITLLVDVLTSVTRRDLVTGGMIDTVQVTARAGGMGMLALAFILMSLTNYAWLPISFITEAALTPRAAVEFASGAIAAGRDVRLAAYLIDLCILACCAGLGMLPGDLSGSNRWAAAGGGLCAALCLAFQWWLVVKTGQSLGKRWMGVRITRLDGGKVGFVRVVLVRSWIFAIAESIPYLRTPTTVLDPLLIFTPACRCLHDYLAGTVVVRCPPRRRDLPRGPLPTRAELPDTTHEVANAFPRVGAHVELES